jgi:CubicO group peptidase (beta-lactamase class C family)
MFKIFRTKIMKRLICILLFLYVFTGLPIQAFSQNYENQFDKILSGQNFENSPGFSVLVAKNNEVIYRKAFGYANLEHEIKLQPEHIFHIASITKQFTACAILKLAEEGKLSLQDDVTKFIEDYPTEGHEITIEHLLTHTSGIKNYTSSKEWNAEMAKKDFTPGEMIDFFKNDSLDFAPGEKYRYSNSAYIILGYIIETVSGKTYEEYLRDSFFIPLGMENTSYGSTRKIKKHRVSGYHKKDNEFENAGYMSMVQPHAAGALMANADDLFKWYTAVINGNVISNRNRIKAHTSYLLNNGKPTGYGFGWHLGNIQGLPMIHHGGGISGFSSYSLYIPAEKVFVAVLSNCDGMSSKNKAFKLAAAAVNKPFDWKKIHVKNEVLREYEAVYESDEEAVRTVIIENDNLMHVHPSGNRLLLIPFGKDSFFVENNFTVFSFERDSENEIISLSASGTGFSPEVYSKTDKPVNVKREVQLPENVLEKYIGKYELMPDFIITISKKGDKIFAKTSKQPDFEIAAYGENKFFSKEFPLEFVFQSDENGRISQLIVLQGGEHRAKKIE